MAIDQFSDSSFKLLAQRIKDRPEFVPLVKQASLDVEEHSSLPNTAFAWQEERLFPLHTPEQAALSYLYATEKTAEVPSSVLQTLEGALEAYGVEIPKTQKVAAQELDTATYLLPELKRWKVTDPESVKLAEQALREHGRSLSVEQRAYAAARLMEKAASYGMDVDYSTIQNAGGTVSDIDTVRDWVEVRATVAPAEHRDAYVKIAESLTKAEVISTDRPALVKLAAMINDLDRAAGLSAMYGRTLPDPIETVFNTSKIAEETVDIAGRPVSVSKLASLPEHIYKDMFGQDFLDEIKTGSSIDTQKLATILPTMPRDLTNVFLKQFGPYLR